MTVMPNFRLAKLTHATSRLICSHFHHRRVIRRVFHGRYEPKGERKALIKQYGCAGCHEIKGFEEEQRIGKELTVEGATPIERLDFALLTHPCSEGTRSVEASTRAKPSKILVQPQRLL